MSFKKSFIESLYNNFFIFFIKLENFVFFIKLSHMFYFLNSMDWKLLKTRVFDCINSKNVHTSYQSKNITRDYSTVSMILNQNIKTLIPLRLAQFPTFSILLNILLYK